MRAIAIITWPALVAPVLGPPLGGFITDLFVVALDLLSEPAAGLHRRSCSRCAHPDNARRREAPPFDWPGFVLCGIALHGAASRRWN